MALSPLKADVEEQKRIAAEELPNIPKINKPVEIEMIDQQPKGFDTNYVSDKVDVEPHVVETRYVAPVAVYNNNPYTSKAHKDYVLPTFKQEPYKPLLAGESNVYRQEPISVSQVRFDLNDKDKNRA